MDLYPEDWEVNWEQDPTLSGGSNYNGWLPTNPTPAQAGTSGDPIASWGNSPWVPNVSNNPMDGGEMGFGSPNARRIAGPSSIMDMVGSYFSSIGAGGTPIMEGDWENAGQGLGHATRAAMQQYNNNVNPYQRDAGQKYAQAYGGAQGAIRAGQTAARATNQGAYIQNDPALQAAQNAWAQTSKPMIQDQFSMMGLGRSGGAGQALANSWTQNSTPFIQDAIAREGADIDRRMAGQFQAANAFQNQAGLVGGTQSIGDNLDMRKNMGIQNEIAANEALMGRGDRINQKRMDLMDRGMSYGQQFRDIAQQANDAQYDDYLRRQGLAEQLLMGPMGMLQSSVGTSTSTSGGK
jgi:hypothetical protein